MIDICLVTTISCIQRILYIYLFKWRANITLACSHAGVGGRFDIFMRMGIVAKMRWYFLIIFGCKRRRTF